MSVEVNIPWVSTNTPGDDKQPSAADASATTAKSLHLPESSVPESKDAVGILSKSELKLRDLIQEVAESHGLERNSITWYFDSDTREGSIRIQTIWPRAEHLTDIELAVYGTSSKDEACKILYRALQNWVFWLVDVYEVLASFIESRPESTNCRVKVTVLARDLITIGSDGKTDEGTDTELGPVILGLDDKLYEKGETDFLFTVRDDRIDNAIQQLRMIEEEWLQAEQDMHNNTNDKRPIPISKNSLGVIPEGEET